MLLRALRLSLLLRLWLLYDRSTPLLPARRRTRRWHERASTREVPYVAERRMSPTRGASLAKGVDGCLLQHASQRRAESFRWRVKFSAKKRTVNLGKRRRKGRPAASPAQRRLQVAWDDIRHRLETGPFWRVLRSIPSYCRRARGLRRPSRRRPYVQSSTQFVMLIVININVIVLGRPTDTRDVVVVVVVIRAECTHK